MPDDAGSASQRNRGVNEGDEVKAGQVVARITGPEYEAQLHTAQANVLVAEKRIGVN